MTEWWTVDQCADHWGIAPVTWRAYVSRGHAPPAAPTRDPRSGRKRWRADVVRAWVRPGRGARTDLRSPAG